MSWRNLGGTDSSSRDQPPGSPSCSISCNALPILRPYSFSLGSMSSSSPCSRRNVKSTTISPIRSAPGGTRSVVRWAKGSQVPMGGANLHSLGASACSETAWPGQRHRAPLCKRAGALNSQRYGSNRMVRSPRPVGRVSPIFRQVSIWAATYISGLEQKYTKGGDY
jgi:hypothetical protein